MNKEQIEQAAKKLVFGYYLPTDREARVAYSWFLNGVEWALQNQWISVEEALPPIREKDIENRSWSDFVLIMTHEGGTFLDCYAFHRKEWLNNGNYVTHWMPIPSLKGGEK